MGYGFVETSSEEDANVAIEKLHQTELDGRKINVERATSTKTGKRLIRNNNTSNTNREANKNISNENNPNTSSYTNKNNSNRSNRPRINNNTKDGQQKTGNRNPPKVIPKKESSEKSEIREKIIPSYRNIKKPQVPREPSETKLYVANIPFSLTDEDLAKEFTFTSFDCVSAKVIVNKKK